MRIKRARDCLSFNIIQRRGWERGMRRRVEESWGYTNRNGIGRKKEDS